MCEFKIVKKNDGSQILEDIVILSYTEDSELLFNVNTLNQTCIVLEHPLIRGFIDIIQKVNNKTISKSEIEIFEKQLDALKKNL
jgi:hypothetical protein